jgi:hypothetical protein
MLLPLGKGAERIDLLMLVKDSRINGLRMHFDGEPSIDYSIIVTRDERIPESDLRKLIRLYFPRSYTEFREYEVLLFSAPNYDLLTTKQDKWIHDTIEDGSGGINDGSIFSQIPSVYQTWASGLAWQAFPNDAPQVAAKYGAWSTGYHYVEINRDHPEPILTTFIPFEVEKYHGGQSRAVIPPQGSGTLAWQVGNYAGKEAFITAWEYGEGRAMTIGSGLPLGWLAYPTGDSARNKYSPEILVNMMFWLASTPLIDDVEVFHRVKSDFADYLTRMKVLISLSDFIDKFGANTQRIQEEVIPLERIYSEASTHYLEHDFVESEIAIKSGLVKFPMAEEVAKREKDKALLWVFVIEWLVTSSTLFLSVSVLWMLMVRRRLYRAVEVTKLDRMKE